MSDQLAGKLAAQLRAIQDSTVRILKRCESRMTIRQKKAVFILFVIAAMCYFTYLLVSAFAGTGKKDWLGRWHDTAVSQSQTPQINTKK